MAHIESGNATISGIIGLAAGWVWNVAIPKIGNSFQDWAWHTLGAMATATVVAVWIYHLNKWLKKRDGK